MDADHGTPESLAHGVKDSDPDAVQRWIAAQPFAQVMAGAIRCVMGGGGASELRDGDTTVATEDKAEDGGQGLRAVARLTPEEVAAAINQSMAGLQKVLCGSVEVLREGFQKLDERARDAVDGETGVSKFATFTPSCGGIDAFHGGLLDRVGE